MANRELYVAGVKTNIDKLSARVIEDALARIARNATQDGADFLRAKVPKHSGDMEKAVSSRFETYSLGAEYGSMSRGVVGIPEIHKAGESARFSGKYPLFVDQGTGLFDLDDPHMIFPTERKAMKLPPKGDYPLFHKQVKGQRGQFFMAETYAYMKSRVRYNTFRAELTSRLKADKLE